MKVWASLQLSNLVVLNFISNACDQQTSGALAWLCFTEISSGHAVSSKHLGSLQYAANREMAGCDSQKFRYQSKSSRYCKTRSKQVDWAVLWHNGLSCWHPWVPVSVLIALPLIQFSANMSRKPVENGPSTRAPVPCAEPSCGSYIVVLILVHFWSLYSVGEWTNLVDPILPLSPPHPQ